MGMFQQEGGTSPYAGGTSSAVASGAGEVATGTSIFRQGSRIVGSRSVVSKADGEDDACRWKEMLQQEGGPVSSPGDTSSAVASGEGAGRVGKAIFRGWVPELVVVHKVCHQAEMMMKMGKKGVLLLLLVILLPSTHQII